MSTIVYCENTECIHYDHTNFICTKSAITLSPYRDEGCDDFESYLETEEYKNKYYAAIAVDGVKAKEVRQGKKIEYNGRVFFTEDRVTDDEEYKLTDGRTGFMCGTFKSLKIRWEKLLEAEKGLPDVRSYPLAIRADNGKCKIIGGKNDERT